MALKPAARLPSAAWRKNRVSLLVILTPTPLELTLSGSYPPDSVIGQSWGFLRQALGVRSGFFDLFPKDENKETEVIAASVSSCLFWYRPLYNAATFFSSFVIARLMKSLIVMPVEATKAATRECNSDGIRRFSLPL